MKIKRKKTITLTLTEDEADHLDAALTRAIGANPTPLEPEDRAFAVEVREAIDEVF